MTTDGRSTDHPVDRSPEDGDQEILAGSTQESGEATDDPAHDQECATTEALQFLSDLTSTNIEGREACVNLAMILGYLKSALAAARQALRDLLEPWDADCEDCADADGFCDTHLAKWAEAVTRARVLAAGVDGPQAS